MKSTGIVRHLDTLGRVVLPKELRDTMELGAGEPVEIYTSEDTIVLKKYIPDSNKNCGYCDNCVNNPDHSSFCKDCGRKLKK